MNIIIININNKYIFYKLSKFVWIMALNNTTYYLTDICKDNTSVINDSIDDSIDDSIEVMIQNVREFRFTIWNKILFNLENHIALTEYQRKLVENMHEIMFPKVQPDPYKDGTVYIAIAKKEIMIVKYEFYGLEMKLEPIEFEYGSLEVLKNEINHLLLLLHKVRKISTNGILPTLSANDLIDLIHLYDTFFPDIEVCRDFNSSVYISLVQNKLNKVFNKCFELIKT